MHLRLPLSFVGLLVASQSLAGCFPWLFDRNDPPPPDLVPPTEERVAFAYTASRGCAAILGGGCEVDHPLLAGVHETVLVTATGRSADGDLGVVSSDPSVVAISQVTRNSQAGDATFRGTFRVLAGASAGSAVVTVSVGGEVIGTTVLRVDTAAGMNLVEDEGTAHYDAAQDHLSLRVGERASMTGQVVSALGEPLFANDGVAWSVPDASRVNLSWSFASGAAIADDHVYVTGVAAGTAVLTVRAGVVERTVVVDVR